MSGKLTKRVVESLAPQEKPYFEWDAGDGAVKGFGVAVHPSGKRVFVAQFRIGSGRAAKTKRATIGPFGVWTVDGAREAAADLIREGAQGIDRAAEVAAKVAGETAAQRAADEERRRARDLRLTRLAARYLREHIRPKKKPATVTMYRHALKAHILPALGKLDAREISRQDVTRFHLGLKDKPAMANRAVAILSAIYGWAEQQELLPQGHSNPTRYVEMFREQVHERFLSVDELRRLGDAIRLAETVGVQWNPRAEGKSKHAPKADNRKVKIDPAAAAALRLLIFTGARLREILHLEWASVDVDRGLLRLRDSKTGPKTILLNGPARAVLSGLDRSGKYVIKGVDGEPKADLKRPWKLVCKAADLSNLRIHDLRHSFASVGASDGHGLIIVGKLLGHSQSRTTERYAHLDNDPLRRASDAIAGKIAAAMGEAPAQPSGEVLPFKKASSDAA